MALRRIGEVARTLARLDVEEAVVEKIVAGGDGLVRIDGAPIFVVGAAPGDRLKIEIVERRPDYGRARIVEILEAGPGRRPAPCPHFGRCGGCDLQHLGDDLQAKLKVEAALETLRRIGRLRPPPVKLIRGRDWGYRVRAQVRLQPAVGGGLEVGYFARGSHDLVAIEGCPILVPELERAVLGLREHEGDVPSRLDVTVGDQESLSCAPPIDGWSSGPVSRRIAGESYQYDARTFFQAHVDLLHDLVREVVGPWRGGAALDLYAGVGLFSLPLARRYEAVVAVESDRVAARYARKNARAARLGHLEVEGLSVEQYLGRRTEPVERVILDPPRSGLGRPVKRDLKRLAPQRISYLSCHPATLARDLADLADAYELESLVCFDLFPQTGHLETLAQLTLRSS
jgi:23S rRNA (uracil1939-C5)-methyltransferase